MTRPDDSSPPRPTRLALPPRIPLRPRLDTSTWPYSPVLDVSDAADKEIINSNSRRIAVEGKGSKGDREWEWDRCWVSPRS
jgi:hypothetical protein